MKKILSAVAGICVSICCAVSGYALEAEDIRTEDVGGKYNYSKETTVKTSASENGEYTVTLDNGISVTVRSEDEDMRLVVREITEDDEKAYEWFESCVDNMTEDFAPLDIYFIDEAGNRVELPDGTDITISTNGKSQYIVALSYDGEATKLTMSSSDGAFTFDSNDKYGYYIVCEAPYDVQSPQTGDCINATLIVLALVLSACAVICLVSEKKICDAEK